MTLGDYQFTVDEYSRILNNLYCFFCLNKTQKVVFVCSLLAERMFFKTNIRIFVNGLLFSKYLVTLSGSHFFSVLT